MKRTVDAPNRLFSRPENVCNGSKADITGQRFRLVRRCWRHLIQVVMDIQMGLETPLAQSSALAMLRY